MKPANTDSPSQSARRKNAILGAASSALMRLASAGFVSKLMLIIIVLDLGSVPLIWISLKTRLKEIQGGEEDAAAQY